MVGISNKGGFVEQVKSQRSDTPLAKAKAKSPKKGKQADEDEEGEEEVTWEQIATLWSNASVSH